MLAGQAGIDIDAQAAAFLSDRFFGALELLGQTRGQASCPTRPLPPWANGAGPTGWNRNCCPVCGVFAPTDSSERLSFWANARSGIVPNKASSSLVQGRWPDGLMYLLLPNLRRFAPTDVTERLSRWANDLSSILPNKASSSLVPRALDGLPDVAIDAQFAAFHSNRIYGALEPLGQCAVRHRAQQGHFLLGPGTMVGPADVAIDAQSEAFIQNRPFGALEPLGPTRGQASCPARPFPSWSKGERWAGWDRNGCPSCGVYQQPMIQGRLSRWANARSDIVPSKDTSSLVQLRLTDWLGSQWMPKLRRLLATDDTWRLSRWANARSDIVPRSLISDAFHRLSGETGRKVGILSDVRSLQTCSPVRRKRRASSLSDMVPSSRISRAVQRRGGVGMSMRRVSRWAAHFRNGALEAPGQNRVRLFAQELQLGQRPCLVFTGKTSVFPDAHGL